MRDWSRGVLSHDEAFTKLYEEYGPLVHTWLRARSGDAAADDLFQDVWGIFCRRWREWEPPPGAADADARPVLSFLFRTCHLVLMAHRRVERRRSEDPLEHAAEPPVDGHTYVLARVQLGECLSAARASCSDDQVAVLTAKLAGVPAREIARTLGLTEATVDHRFRDAIARIRERLEAGGRERR